MRAIDQFAWILVLISYLESDVEKDLFKNYVENVKKSLDTSINPADDIFAYACGNYDEKKADLLDTDWDDFIEVVFQNETEIKEGSAIWKAKTFYESCLKEKSLKDILEKSGLYQKFGGWPAFDDNWNADNYKWRSNVIALKTFGIATVFNHFIQYYDADDPSLVININFMEIPRFSSLFADDRTERKFLEEMKIDPGKIEEILSDVQLIGVKMMTILQDAGDEGKKTDKDDISQTYYYFRKVPSNETFNARSYFEEYFQQVLGDDTAILIISPNKFTNLINFMESVEKRSLANYLMWLSLKEYSKGQHCDKQVIHYFKTAIVASALPQFYTEFDKVRHSIILKRFLETVASLKYPFCENVIKDLEKYTEREDSILEYWSRYFNLDTIQSDFESLNIDPDNYYSNIKSCLQHKPGKTLRKYLSSDKEDYILMERFNAFIQEAIIWHGKPILHHFVTAYHSLWGSIIYDQFLKKDGFISISLSQVIDCYMNQFTENKFIGTRYTASKALSTVIALDRAFEDYMKWINEYPSPEMIDYQNEILKQNGFTHEKVFFTAFAQTFCHKIPALRRNLVLSFLNYEKFSSQFLSEDTKIDKLRCPLHSLGKENTTNISLEG